MTGCHTCPRTPQTKRSTCQAIAVPVLDTPDQHDDGREHQERGLGDEIAGLTAAAEGFMHG